MGTIYEYCIKALNPSTRIQKRIVCTYQRQTRAPDGLSGGANRKELLGQSTQCISTQTVLFNYHELLTGFLGRVVWGKAI